jgi:hypothetical protein
MLAWPNDGMKSYGIHEWVCAVSYLLPSRVNPA